MALEHCTARGVLHRDIKSQNIFLTSDGNVMIGDFGLATVREGGDDEDHSLVGTPHFMSPELLSKKPYSFKSDLWSLGVLMYELTAQRPPFTAFNIQGLIHKIKTAPAPPLPTTVSADWALLLRHMLRKSPKQRPSPRMLLNTPCLREAYLEARRRAKIIMPGVELSPLAEAPAPLPPLPERTRPTTPTPSRTPSGGAGGGGMLSAQAIRRRAGERAAPAAGPGPIDFDGSVAQRIRPEDLANGDSGDDEEDEDEDEEERVDTGTGDVEERRRGPTTEDDPGAREPCERERGRTGATPKKGAVKKAGTARRRAADQKGTPGPTVSSWTPRAADMARRAREEAASTPLATSVPAITTTTTANTTTTSTTTNNNNTKAVDTEPPRDGEATSSSNEATGRKPVAVDAIVTPPGTYITSYPIEATPVQTGYGKNTLLTPGGNAT